MKNLKNIIRYIAAAAAISTIISLFFTVLIVSINYTSQYNESKGTTVKEETIETKEVKTCE